MPKSTFFREEGEFRSYSVRNRTPKISDSDLIWCPIRQCWRVCAEWKAGIQHFFSCRSHPPPKQEPQKKSPQKVPSVKIPAAREEAGSPDEAVAACQRVAKLQTVFATLGEEDKMCPTLLAVLKKAVTGAGAPCVCASHHRKVSFRGPRSAWNKAREALAEAVCLGEGGRSFGREREREEVAFCRARICREWIHSQGFPQPRWIAHFSG